MKQEYLITDISVIDRLNEITYEGVNKELIEISNKKAYVLSFSILGENEDGAKRLSEVQSAIYEDYHCIILENGCSEYFNRTLFPLINGFECKLRKLLYLASEFNNDDKIIGKNNIVDLESKELGAIFDLLFTDPGFNKAIRSLPPTLNWQFTKESFIKKIKNMNETTLWDSLLSGSVPALREDYLGVKDARNDVMHAHYMDYKKYLQIKKQFKKINLELAMAINNFIIPKKQPQMNRDFNKILRDAMVRNSEIVAEFIESTKISNVFQTFFSNTKMIGEELSKTYLSSNAFALQQHQQQINEIQSRFTESKSFSEMIELQEEFRKISEQIGDVANKKFQECVVNKNVFNSINADTANISKKEDLNNNSTGKNDFK